MLVSAALLYWISQVLILNSFQTLEADGTEDNLARAVNVVEGSISNNTQRSQDWAYWDEAYAYMLQRNVQFIRKNLDYDASYQSLDISAMLFIDPQQQLLYAGGFDHITEQRGEVDPEFIQQVLETPTLLEHEDWTGYTEGLMLLEDGRVMVVASRYVLTNNLRGPPRGILVWGRLLDEEVVQGYRDRTKLDIEIYPLNQPDLPADVQRAMSQLSLEQSVYTTPLDQDNIAGYRLLPDIYGQPAIVVRIERPRTIYQEGVRTLFSLGAAIVGIAIGLVALTLTGLEWTVLSRLARLNKEVESIGKPGAQTERVTVGGQDEIGNLGKVLNQTFEALEQAREAELAIQGRLKSVVTNAPIILFGADAEGKLTLMMGKGLENFSSLSPDELLGQHIEAIYHNFPDALEAYRQALKGQASHGVFEFESAKIVLDTHLAPIYDDNGQVSGVIGVSTDISNLRQAMKALERAKNEAEAANRAKSTFLANMSHELRTPMNAIIGYTTLVLDGIYGDISEKQRDRLQRVVDNGQHLLSLINNVLDLSKIEAGKIELVLEDFAIRPLVEDVVSSVRPLIEKNSNELILEIPQDIGHMYTDMTRLRQILFNLLGNASKFTEKGQITLSIERTPNLLRMSIKDTGIGITPEQLQHIFIEFTQADSTTTRKYGGTGLGLTISRRFSRLMGGDILVESTPGEGSTFTLILPTDSTKPIHMSSDSIPPGTASTLLVIDDDPDVHNILRDSLERTGLYVLSAFNGEDGLQMARTVHPSVVVLDVMMPNLDGWTVLNELKNDPKLRDIPVIMLSMVEDRQRGYSLGASEYLNKPVDHDRLQNLLKKYMCVEPPCPLLVVEDDPDIRRLLKDMLQVEGWEVDEAENGAAALEQIKHKRPSAILLDLMMPVMNGFDFLEALRGRIEWRGIPVIILTARELSEEDRRRLNGDFQQLIQKGAYNRSSLLEEVHRQIRVYAHPPTG
jgi:signal transduction histidine kinase/DNA-binding response OmpR family regulator/sensor domain CHASE-containing protein